MRDASIDAGHEPGRLDAAYLWDVHQAEETVEETALGTLRRVRGLHGRESPRLCRLPHLLHAVILEQLKDRVGRSPAEARLPSEKAHVHVCGSDIEGLAYVRCEHVG